MKHHSFGKHEVTRAGVRVEICKRCQLRRRFVVSIRYLAPKDAVEPLYALPGRVEWSTKKRSCEQVLPSWEPSRGAKTP